MLNETETIRIFMFDQFFTREEKPSIRQRATKQTPCSKFEMSRIKMDMNIVDRYQEATNCTKSLQYVIDYCFLDSCLSETVKKCDVGYKR